MTGVHTEEQRRYELGADWFLVDEGSNGRIAARWRNLWRLDLSDRSETQITSENLILDELDVSPDGKRVVFVASNPWFQSDIDLGQGRVIRWKSSDGLEVEGMLSVPAGYDGKEQIPLLVVVHGGPPQQWGNEFYYESHLYAGLGYAVFGPNVRGSSGYGDDFIKALIGNIGGGEYEDIMTGVDYVIDMGIADPDRLAIRGWSWGGVLSSWTITQTDRFKAASVGAGVMRQRRH